MFDVVATDNGKPFTESSTASVTITVNSPENFNNPVLGRSSYSGTLVESAPPGTPILTVTATDADASGPASIVMFYLKGANAGLFSIENFNNNTALLRSKYIYIAWICTCTIN